MVVSELYLRDLCPIQTDRRIITMIICNEEPIFRFDDRRVTIAVFRIAFQQSAFQRKGEITAVSKRRTHINERKSSVIADRQNEGSSFGAFPILEVFSETMVTDRIENRYRSAVNQETCMGESGDVKRNAGVTSPKLIPPSSEKH